jgi:type I restriction enzyme S subunit
MKGRIGWQGLKQSEFLEEPSLPYLITGMNFKDGNIRWEEVYHITEERYNEAPEIQLKQGDVLMTKDGTIGKLLFIDKLPGKASLNSHLLVFRPLNNEYFSRYLFYQLQTDYFLEHIELTKTGTTFFGISQEACGRFNIILPPFEEQTIIANYLDQKTTQIDDLIAKKERLIQLLEEERTTIINQAVTKGLPAEERLKAGLDPTVPMKDSGIEWLGEIPAHWDTAKLKLFVDKITDGSHHSPPTEEQGKRYLSVKDIGNNEIKFDGCKLISENEFEILVRNGCQPIKGDILLTKDGTIGRAAIVSDDHDFVVLSSLGIIRPNHDKFDSNFLREWLVSDLNVNQMLSLIQGSALTRITITIIKNLFVLVPPIEEQRSIMEWLKTKVESINDICQRVESEIDLLKEYKTALISEVVTGKVDVRNEKLN